MSFLARLGHLLTPQESNNYRARLLHHSSMTSFIAIFLIIQLALTSLSFLKPSILGYASQISPERVVELTNIERSKVGAPPLKLNSLLSESAQRKAGDMFAFNYWAHNSPSGRDPWSFFKEAGYRYLYAGENLAKDFPSPEAVVSAWMASPSHRENLLNPKYQEIGVSVVDGTLNGSATTLVVQHFGTSPQSLAQVSPKAPATTETAKQSPRAEPVIKTVTPTQILTPTPLPTVVLVAQQEPLLPAKTATLAQTSRSVGPLVSPFNFTQKSALVILVVIMGTLVLDSLLVYRRRIFRLGGRSLAHFFFLGGAILIILLSKQGVIS